MQLFVRSLEGHTVVVQLGPRPRLGDLVDILEPHGSRHCSLLRGGRLVQGHPGSTLQELGLDHDCTLQLAGRLAGGKGGFGSNLRAAGKARLTDNFDACRDLQGRRVRHITAAVKLEEWKAQAADRQLERIAQQHMKKLAKEERARAREEVDVAAVQSETRAAVAGGMAEVQAALRAGRGAAPAAGPAPGPGSAKRLRMDPLAVLSDGSDSEDSDGMEAALVGSTRPSPGGTSGSAELDVFRPESTAEPQTCGVEAASAAPEGVAERSGDGESPSNTQGPATEVPTEAHKIKEEDPELDLASVTSASELQALGLDRLKRELGRRGLKVGGTLAQRAQRLFDARPTPEQ